MRWACGPIPAAPSSGFRFCDKDASRLLGTLRRELGRCVFFFSLDALSSRILYCPQQEHSLGTVLGTTHAKHPLVPHHTTRKNLYITSFLDTRKYCANGILATPTLKAVGSNPIGYAKEKSPIFLEYRGFLFVLCWFALSRRQVPSTFTTASYASSDSSSAAESSCPASQRMQIYPLLSGWAASLPQPA